MGHTVDSITLLGRAHKQISAKRKERLKPVLNEDIRTLCEKETSDSKYLFGENLLESMKEAKESFRISNSLVNNYTAWEEITPDQEVLQTVQGMKLEFEESPLQGECSGFEITKNQPTR